LIPVPATDDSPELTVVVPVFRNAAKIAELSARLDRAISSRSYELLFVDDASPDDARSVIRGLAEDDPRVCGIVLAENVGQNRAVLAGLAAARGLTVVVMDGDLQDPPEAVPVLLAALERSGADAVFAARRGRYETTVRLATSRLLKRTLWVLTRGKVPRDAGLFLIVRRAVADRVVTAAGSDPYVPVLVAHAARSVATVPIERGQSSSSSYTSAMRRRVARRAVVAALRLDTGLNTYSVAARIGRRFPDEEPA
jgi:glycosyltransferase involved in cell wall biosynthesis